MTATPAQTYKRLLGYTRAYWVFMVAAVIAMVVEALAGYHFTKLMEPLVNRGFVNPEPRMAVILPLTMGGIASTGLLCLVLSWNEAFWVLNLTSAKAGTLATLIASYSSPEGLFWAKLSAASLMAIAPIVVFGWFSQKQLVQGLTFGAVK